MIENSNTIGKLVVISGFSGSGKDTLMNMFLEARPTYQRIVTHTSRPIRPGEIHGRDYYFVSHQEFENMIKEERLIEHVLYGTHYKGTSKDEFRKVLLGQNIVWRIDLSRAAVLEETIGQKFDDKTSTKLISSMTKIIIKVSPDEALGRYKNREGENASLKEFKKRLDADLVIWNKYRNSFPHTIENVTGKVDDALNKMIEIIENSQPSHIHPPQQCVGCGNLINPDKIKGMLPDPPCYDNHKPPKDLKEECKYHFPEEPPPKPNLP